MVKKNTNKGLELEIQQAKNFEILIKEVLPLVKDYFTTKLEKVDSPRFKISTLVFGGLLFIIVLITAFLVYIDKLAADNFTFLIGIIVGYAMTHLKNIITIQE